MVRRLQLTSLILTAAAFFGCKDTLSSGGGGLAINVQFSESAANASFDAARIRIIGETDRTVNTTPGAEEVIEGLAPGSYRVVLEGLQGDEVELLGQQNNVSVTAGNTTDVTITFSSFVPALNGFTGPSPTLRFDVGFASVPGAAGYVIEWDTDASFGDPESIPLTATTGEVRSVPGDVYVRVRAATEFNTFSVPSNVEVINVAPVAISIEVAPADLDTLIGAGDTIQFSVVTTDANGDEFTSGALSWQSSNETVATVDAEGRVIAQTNGSADIIASVDGIQDQGTLTSLTMQADSALFFPYDMVFRPIGIAWDGNQYWTANGGNAASGRIKRYDENGNYVDSLIINLDVRGIYYRQTDATIYLKNGGLDWLSFDQSDSTLVPLETGIFADFQSSPALTPDEETIIEHVRDSIRFLDFTTKEEYLLLTGVGGLIYPHDVSVATDGHFIYLWNSAGQVLVYDFQARLVTTFPLPVTPLTVAGLSLSYTNDMLFVIDSGTQTGTWYGFKLSPATPTAPPAAPFQTGASPLTECRTGDTLLCR